MNCPGTWSPGWCEYILIQLWQYGTTYAKGIIFQIRVCQSIWTSSIDHMVLPCWFNLYVLPSEESSNLLSRKKRRKKKPRVCPTHVKFKAGQGRICYVMCWGLQHFIGLLHNRKPGTHCLPGLKQQACPVLPPPLPCDTKEDMWPIIDKKAGGWGGGGGVWGKECMCFWTPSISTPGQFCWGGFGTAVSFYFPNASYIFASVQRGRMSVLCSANLYPRPVMRYQLIVRGTVQRATCNPCKAKERRMPFPQVARYTQVCPTTKLHLLLNWKRNRNYEMSVSTARFHQIT